MQHLPILRYFAREIGGYDGETNFEKYIVDAVGDIYIDWRVCPSLVPLYTLRYTALSSD
jgi:glutathione S-transferase